VDRWWFAISVTALILASDYKFRTRESGVQSSAVDAAIILELVVYFAVALFAINRHGRPPRLARVPVHVYLACFFAGLTVLSVISAEFPAYTLVRSGQMMIVLVLMLVFIAAPDSSRAHIHRFAHLFLAMVVVSIGYGLAVPSIPLSRLQEGRFTWLAVHPNVSGLMTGLASLVAFAYVLWGNRDRPGPRWPPLLYVITLLIVGGAMLGAHTRGAVLGAIVGGLVFSFARFRGAARVRLLAALAMLGAITVLAATDVVIDYFSRGAQTSELTSLNSRTDLWVLALATVERQPLFGYGVGASRGVFEEQIGLGGAHNAVLNVLVDLGLVGALCWLALIVAITVGALRLPRTSADALLLDRSLLIAVIAFLMIVGIFFEGPGSVANVASTWLFVCVAWLSVAQRDAQRAEDRLAAVAEADTGRAVWSAPSIGDS
jgi:O-antigen ligase